VSCLKVSSTQFIKEILRI